MMASSILLLLFAVDVIDGALVYQQQFTARRTGVPSSFPIDTSCVGIRPLGLRLFRSRKYLVRPGRDDIAESINNKSSEGDVPKIFDRSLEIVAALVSMLFILTVFLWGDRFVVSVPSSVSSSSQQQQNRIIIDADALLKEEFERLPSSVEF
jgi:hypothetical protein